MALLGNRESKEEKKQKEVEKFLEKYKLNNIDEKDYEAIKEISNDLVGLGLMKTGMALSMASADKQATVGFLSALVKQNWIIIRKLDELNKKLEKD